jgi:hypothetical protein
MSSTDWKRDFNKAINTPPNEGVHLKTLDGSPAKIIIELHDGKEPFMYGLIYVPSLVGTPVGWYARGIADKSTYGWKAILLPKARHAILRKHGLNSVQVPVYGLKVVRPSREGKSLLVELLKEPVKVIVPLKDSGIKVEGTATGPLEPIKEVV